MRIGIIGLGHIGHSIASRMHSLGHEVCSWTRSERNVPWINSTDLHKGVEREFDSLFIASGGAKPNFANFDHELATTHSLVSQFTVSKKTKVFYLSSGAVYGECESPRSEIDEPRPKTDYGLVKLLTENKLRENYGDQLFVLRLGNIINQVNPYGIVAHLSSSIQSGVFRAFGEPTDCRDYLGISDFQTLIERLTEVDLPPKVLNLGSGNSVSLEQIVVLLKEAMSNRIDVEWVQRRPGDLSQTRLDVAQVRQLLQNNPQDPIKKFSELIESLDFSYHHGN
jgi:UDP-glucose 4-epimerase